MNSLSDEGKSTEEIRDHLNLLCYRKVRTQTPYTIKDVSKSLLKYRKRLNVKLTSTIGNKKDTLKAVYFGKNKINDYIK